MAAAMRFLTDEWLCDVTTSYAGKCVAIACALSVVERLLLEDRPAFIGTAPQRGGGKTTLFNMISMAVLGTRATAAAWSPNEEERRKALFAYLLQGVPFLVWDNLMRGTVIQCPAIEAALTAATYSDRVLGVSQTPEVSSTTIITFTGNNIAAGADMLSRTLELALEVTRPDPENRVFKHPDPITWTEQHRAQILRALYTLILGNRRRNVQKPLADAKTRFKMWWHLIGAPVEFAAFCVGEAVDFATLFAEKEAIAEDVLGLAGLLSIFRDRWPDGCTSSQLEAALTGDDMLKSDPDKLKTAIEQAAGKRLRDITRRTLTWMLKPLVGTPAKLDDGVFALRFDANKEDAGLFWVARV
jgi:hypothetical protein